MSDAATLDRFLDACAQAGAAMRVSGEQYLSPAVLLEVAAEHWGLAASAARRMNLRWSALWADPRADHNEVFCLLEGAGEYLLLRTEIGFDEALSSHAGIFAAADRPERHARDMLGLAFADAPDERRWTRHQAWPENHFPLREEADGADTEWSPTPADSAYPFVSAQGAGVVEIPVGPIHAGIIEPGHFRFQAIGEVVLNLEIHLGYVHKGIEKIARGRDAEGLVRLAARVSGDSCVAHAWAACQAIERATVTEVPARALWLRAIMAERERIANHLGDIGAICNDVGFAFAQYQMTRLKEDFVRESNDAFGHRFMMDCVVCGGVTRDLDADAANSMVEQANAMASEVEQIIDIIEDAESLEDRLMTTGRLTPEQAQMLGVVGYVGKASGLNFDVRAAAAYPPYNKFEVPVSSYRAGDVAARAKVRADEVGISLALLNALLASLPGGSIRVPVRRPAHSCSGLGIVEGWRGEIVSYVRLEADGRVARFYPRDPSWLLWPALELLQQDNIVPDFPVCNKSINGSYSGQDL